MDDLIMLIKLNYYLLVHIVTHIRYRPGKNKHIVPGGFKNAIR